MTFDNTPKTPAPSWEGIILMCIAAGAPFWMGTIFAPFLGPYGQKLAYDVGWLFLIAATIGVALTFKLQHDARMHVKHLSAITVILMLLLVGVVGLTVAYVHDRYANPSEDYCHDIGTDTREFSSVARAVVLDQGQCIKNETGFHANGRAIFP